MKKTRAKKQTLDALIKSGKIKVSYRDDPFGDDQPGVTYTLLDGTEIALRFYLTQILPWTGEEMEALGEEGNSLVWGNAKRHLKGIVKELLRAPLPSLDKFVLAQQETVDEEDIRFAIGTEVWFYPDNLAKHKPVRGKVVGFNHCGCGCDCDCARYLRVEHKLGFNRTVSWDELEKLNGPLQQLAGASEEAA